MDSPGLPPAEATSTSTLGRVPRDEVATGDAGARRRPRWIEDARRELAAPGCYLAYEDAGRHVVMPLSAEVTRIGRSTAAELRFEDTTVSRRHAVLTREPDGGVRVLDDRSLNGVFVNGERVEWRELGDGDEIVVGRYRLTFLDVGSAAVGRDDPALEAAG